MELEDGPLLVYWFLVMNSVHLELINHLCLPSGSLNGFQELFMFFKPWLLYLAVPVNQEWNYPDSFAPAHWYCPMLIRELTWRFTPLILVMEGLMHLCAFCRGSPVY